jgi:hypothetical protein
MYPAAAGPVFVASGSGELDACVVVADGLASCDATLEMVAADNTKPTAMTRMLCMAFQLLPVGSCGVPFDINTNLKNRQSPAANLGLTSCEPGLPTYYARAAEFCKGELALPTAAFCLSDYQIESSGCNATPGVWVNRDRSILKLTHPR